MPYIGNPIYQSAFVTDTFSGNGTTTAFTMSVAPAGTTNVLVAISGVLQDPSTYGVVGTTITFSTAPPSGTGNISCRYLGIPVTGVTTTAYRTVTEFTATAGQTTFTPPSYTVGFINVYRNGVLLGSADYTATNGTTVVLASGATSGDLVTVESFLVSSVLNAIPNTAGAVSSSNIVSGVTLTAPTFTGTTTLPGGVANSYGIGLGTAVPSSGIGISFPATQSASTDANTLDDYEEGTWTPSIAFDGGSTGITYSSNRTGIYTKVGNIVTVQAIVELTSKGSSTGTFTFITGLPFTTPSYNLYTGSGIGYTAGFVTNAPTAAYINPSATLLVLYNSSSGFIGSSNLSNTSVIGFQCTYRVA